MTFSVYLIFCVYLTFSVFLTFSVSPCRLDMLNNYSSTVSDTGVITLEIKKFSWAEVGEYRIIAENEYGQAVQTIKLDMAGQYRPSCWTWQVSIDHQAGPWQVSTGHQVGHGRSVQAIMPRDKSYMNEVEPLIQRRH